MNPQTTPAAPTPAASPFATPWGTFDLTRFPEDPRERLRPGTPPTSTCCATSRARRTARTAP